MSKQVQIYELEGTNLLYVVTDANSDATYYNKSNLTVEAVNGYVVIANEGVVFFRELPRDFVNPLESSVVDLVEIIQGYINNIIPENQEELNVLGNLLISQNQTNELLDAIKLQHTTSKEMLRELKINNLHLTVITGNGFTDGDINDK